MSQRVLLKILFENAVRSSERDNDFMDLDRIDLMTIKEVDLETAQIIQGYIKGHKYKIMDFTIEFLNCRLIQIDIIKNTASIADLKRFFRIPYSNSQLDLVDIVRINLTYNYYCGVLRSLCSSKNDYICEHSDESSSTLVDLCNEDVFQPYDKFTKQKGFIELTNKIENLQGLVKIPLVDKKMQKIANYDQNIKVIIESYLL